MYVLWRVRVIPTQFPILTILFLEYGKIATHLLPSCIIVSIRNCSVDSRSHHRCLPTRSGHLIYHTWILILLRPFGDCNACLEVKEYRMSSQSRTIALSGVGSVSCPGDIRQTFQIDGLQLEDCFWGTQHVHIIIPHGTNIYMRSLS